MVTSAPVRRASMAVLALAVAGPALLLGGAAWAETPAPLPSGASWISGGTALEGTASTATKPVARPVAPAKKAATTTTHRAQAPAAAPATAGAPDGATALPFTGGHVDALLPAGILLVVGGATLTFVARPRRVLA